MALADLSHSPEFDLPAYGPAFPTDILNLVECNHEGLYRIIVSKMVTRGKYDTIATITCQREPSRKAHPVATSEEIAEYCMLCIQYNIEETDAPGTYRVALHGPPGKGGGWMKSKHIDLTDQDADARSITMLSEGELVEQQGAYIGELHGQIVACMEVVQGVVKPLMQENKEMMKVVADSQRRLAEVEQLRLNHDLQLRIHEDAKLAELAEEERKHDRWKELLSFVDSTGAGEELLKGLISRFMKPKDAIKALTSSESGSSNKTNTRSEKAGGDKDGGKSGAQEPGKKKGKKKKDPSKEEQEEAIKQEKKLYEEAMERVGDNPLVMAAEALKMSVDEKRQWKSIYKTLSDGQSEVFDEIFAAQSDDEIKESVNRLVELGELERLMDLNKQLDDQQKKFVNLILSVIE